MRGSLLCSLLELADSTSQNLGFAHRDDVEVGYGEETITETNLLELRRRHPARIRLTAFTRKKESLNGADWEWHVIGRARRLIMRVQAKRVQKNGVLRVSHVVKGSGRQQIDLLIANARADGRMPVYCLYASEAQRSYWKAQSPADDREGFEYGCLLASAHKIRARNPKALGDIEKDCIPWHYLVERRRFSRPRAAELPVDASGLSHLMVPGQLDWIEGEAHADVPGPLGAFPTIDELNRAERPERDMEGVVELPSTALRPPVQAAVFRERGIRLVLETDVSEIPHSPPPGPPPAKRAGGED